MSSLAFGLASYLGGDTVPLTATYASLDKAVRQLGQWENSGDITSDVMLQALNFALLETYDIVVQKWLDYYTIDVDFVLTSGTSAYALSDVAPGFYKLRHLDYTQDTTIGDGTQFYPMLPYSLDAASRYQGRSVTSRNPPRYRIQGQSLVLSSPASGVIRVYYIPAPYQFSGATDTNEVAFDAPVEIKLVVQIAQRDLLERSELSTAECEAKINKLTALLRTAADGRDAGQPFYLDPRGPSRRIGWLDGECEGW